MDLKAIADALAARHVGVTANGESLLLTTASLPNAINSGPVLLVYPPSGTRSVGPGKQRDDEAEFFLRLLRDPLDVPSRTDALYAWYAAIQDKVLEDTDLGLAYVSWAYPSSFRLELDGQTYGGSLYDVVEIGVLVHIHETVTTMSQ